MAAIGTLVADEIGKYQPTTAPSTPTKADGCAPLPLNADPYFTGVMHGLVRRWPAVDADARRVIGACRTGRSPWPLVMLGPTGSGKSCAALCVLDSCRWGVYFTVRQVVEKKMQAANGELYQKNPLSPNRVGEVEMMDYLTRCELLILDEIAKRAECSPNETDIVHELLSRRHGKPTIVISNRTLREIASAYDGAVASRLSAGTVLKMDGADRRMMRSKA